MDNQSVRSLWTALHDARLVRIASQTDAGSVTLAFRSPHLQQFHGIPKSVRFLFQLEGVLSVAVRQTVPHPPFVYREGESGPERMRRMQEWRPVWRVESVSWPAFESALDEDANLDIMNADLTPDADGVTLSLEGNYEGTVWTQLNIRAATLSITRADGQPFDLDTLVALGDAFWDAFNQPASIDPDA